MTTYAFCLGVNQYTPPILALRCAERDAIKLAALMGETLGFEADVLEERTTSGIERRIEALGARLRPGDSFVFYFSGHGKVQGDDHLLLLPEARLHMLESGATVTSGLLSWQALRTLTAQPAWQGVQRVFVIDACRTKLLPIEKGNGELPAFDGHVLLRNLRPARKKPSERDQPPYTLLTACDHGEPAVELPDGSSSVFNAALMQDLRDARRTGAWRVDARAAQRLHQRVEALRTEHRLTAPAYKQTPQWRGAAVELPLRRGEPPPPPPAPPPPPDEESAWATAQAADTVRAYERYLAEFPAGRYAERAQVRIRLLRQEQQGVAAAAARRLKAAGAVVALLVGAGLVWAFVQDTAHREVGEPMQTALVRQPLAGPEPFKPAPSERDFSILDDKALLERAQVEPRWAELSAASEGGDLNAVVLMAIAKNEGLEASLTILGPDDHGAAALLRRAADKGHSRAMSNLGVMLERGWGGTLAFLAGKSYSNQTEAVRWYRRAAEAGNAYGMYRLARVLDTGNGVEKNDEEAVRLYRRAAEAGHLDSMISLGAALEHGWGVKKNEPEAVRWYRAAAAAGNADGMNSLGLMLADGRGAEKRESEAVDWFRRAVNAGDKDAMFNLGGMLESGRGVEKSESEAVGWYRRAAQVGHDGAKSALKRLGKTE